MPLKLTLLFFLFCKIAITPSAGFGQVNNSILLGQGTDKSPLDTDSPTKRFDIRSKDNGANAYSPKKKTVVSPKPEKSKKPASESEPVVIDKAESGSVSGDSKDDLAESAELTENQVQYTSGVTVEGVHPDDVRRNRIEFDLMAGWEGNSSASNFSYRNYGLSYAVVDFRGRIWISENVGLSGTYGLGLNGDVAGGYGTNDRVIAKPEFMQINLDYRRIFGESRRAPTVQFGLTYLENKLIVGGDESSRASLKSAGAGVCLFSRWPRTPRFSWTIRTLFSPRLTHQELPTALALKSGASPETSRLGLEIGGEFKFDRHHQILWEISHHVERNQFSGAADLVDPQTGASPRNVSVTNSWTGLRFGFRWGQ